MAKPRGIIERLSGEPLPTIRLLDGLTLDHPSRPYPPVQRWRYSAWLRGAAFLGIAVGAIIIVTSIEFGIFLQVRSDSHAFIWFELVGALAGYLIVVLIMEQRRPPLELAPRRALGLVRGLILGLVLIGLCVGLLAAVGAYRVAGWNGSYNPWPDLLWVGLVAGVAEELMFRGMLLRLVEEALGSWGAVAVSAVVFGLLHLSNADATVWGAVAIAIEAGLLFAAIYLLTRSLWWCIGLHIAWNIAEGPFFGSVVSGNGAQQSWIVAAWHGPDILTGGSFGLEASIVPVVLLGALGVALLIYAQRRGVLVAPAWVRRAKAAQAAPKTAKVKP